MSEELQTAPGTMQLTTTGPISKSVGNVEVSAESPPDFQVAQGILVEWARNKVASVAAEHAECEGAYLHAKKCKWKSDVLQRQTEKAKKRLEYYQKILAALEAGYVIVPPFPFDVFAIRTTTKKPTKYVICNKQACEPYLKQDAKTLPVGEGEYQNPFPIVDYSWQPDGKDSAGNVVERRKWFIRGWDEMEFPMSMSKPHIMQAANRAMALRIFDEFCIFEEGSDPMILGCVKSQKIGYSQRSVYFMIAWNLNTKDL